jgi:CrcB protein
MTWLGALAVGLGAALGAWLRWGFGLWLNSLHTMLPLGTVAANLIGGYMVGLAMGFFADFPHISPEWRLLIVTGFLGGLTTFATFSAEAMGLLQKGDYVWALGHSLLHLIGSILFCFAGFATWRALTQ